MLVRVWRKGNPCTLLPEMPIGAVTVEKSIDVSQRTKNRAAPKPSNSTLGRQSGKKKKNTNSKRYTHPNVHSSITCEYPTLGIHGEGNSTPLQYSCLENPMDGGTW